MTNRKDLPDETPLELIKICGPTEAQMIEEMFRNNGIECMLQGDVSSNPWPATGELDEVRVWVRQQDASKAEELVGAFFTPESESELGVEDPDEAS